MPYVSTSMWVNFDYFDWICKEILGFTSLDYKRYSNLLHKLHQTEFKPYHPMDANRIGDARSLRFKYGSYASLSDEIVTECLDHSCDGVSCLEIMAALSNRLYEEFTYSFDYPMDTHYIFWSMIETMHLDNQDDWSYSTEKVERTLQNMMSHNFEKNGDGGLFKISDDSKDMRGVELWYQAQWWLTEKWRETT